MTAFLIAIPAALLAHEAGHWAVARALGYPARLKLTWVGPATAWGSNDRISPKRDRIAVAAAGAAANVALAGLALSVGATAAAQVSLVVGLMQLVPLGPSDGTHILRALRQ